MSNGIEQQVDTALHPLHIECEKAKSELDKALVELQEAHRQIEWMHKSKRELVSALSHEFRSALTTIQGFSEMMCQRDLSVAEMKEFAVDIQQDAQHLARLLSEMLAFERTEMERIQLCCDWLDLNAVILKVVENIQPSTELHTISVKLATALPILMGDAEKLAQALEKLIDNALKYSPDGGAVYVSSAVEGNLVRVCVQDNGIGIPASAINRIFEQYERVETHINKNNPGPGLGLSFVRQVAHMHGGQVWVESVLGEGSRFHLTIPFISAPGNTRML